MKLVAASLIALLALACSGGGSPRNLDLAAVRGAFAKLPVRDPTVVTAAMDRDLGRPGSYTERLAFADARAKSRFSAEAVEQIRRQSPEMLLKCSVMVFPTPADAAGRKASLEAVARAMPPSDHFFLHKNVLVVIDGGVEPAAAAEYKKALEAL